VVQVSEREFRVRIDQDLLRGVISPSPLPSPQKITLVGTMEAVPRGLLAMADLTPAAIADEDAKLP